jgi:hypothetical protein
MVCTIDFSETYKQLFQIGYSITRDFQLDKDVVLVQYRKKKNCSRKENRCLVVNRCNCIKMQEEVDTYKIYQPLFQMEISYNRTSKITNEFVL